MNREKLGRIVHETWIKCAKTKPNFKDVLLIPYDDLQSNDKEINMQIGEAVAAAAAQEIMEKYVELSEEWHLSKSVD